MLGSRAALRVSAAVAVGAEMVALPGGPFLMGSDRHYPEERPQREAAVSPFRIDRFPVTNAQYADFVAATGYATVAERAPDPREYPGVDASALVPGSLVFTPPADPVPPFDFRKEKNHFRLHALDDGIEVRPRPLHGGEWGSSISGGYLYRGAEAPALQGSYVFGDYVSGRIWRGDLEGDEWQVTPLFDPGFNVATFGEDASGELYVADYRGGVIYKVGQ